MSNAIQTAVKLLVAGPVNTATGAMEQGGSDGVSTSAALRWCRNGALIANNCCSGVIVPSLASVFGIFLIRQYALSLPDELLEAARIDGASEARIFWSLVVPLLQPILVTLALITCVSQWNSFMWPLVITSGATRTLP